MVGYIITAVLGVLSILFGPKVAKITGYRTPLSSLGDTEFRATYGAFFLSLGVFGIHFNNSTTQVVLGLSWLSAGVLRLVLTVIKRKDLKENIGGVMFECGIAGLIFLT